MTVEVVSIPSSARSFNHVAVCSFFFSVAVCVFDELLRDLVSSSAIDCSIASSLALAMASDFYASNIAISCSYCAFATSLRCSTSASSCFLSLVFCAIIISYSACSLAAAASARALLCSDVRDVCKPPLIDTSANGTELFGSG